MTEAKAKRLFLLPCTPGTVVRDPRTRVKLPPEGMHVADTSYWRRRVRAGDAIEGKPPAAPKIAAAAEAPSAPQKAKE